MKLLRRDELIAFGTQSASPASWPAGDCSIEEKETASPPTNLYMHEQSINESSSIPSQPGIFFQGSNNETKNPTSPSLPFVLFSLFFPPKTPKPPPPLSLKPPTTSSPFHTPKS